MFRVGHITISLWHLTELLSSVSSSLSSQGNDTFPALALFAVFRGKNMTKIIPLESGSSEPCVHTSRYLTSLTKKVLSARI